MMGLWVAKRLSSLVMNSSMDAVRVFSTEVASDLASNSSPFCDAAGGGGGGGGSRIRAGSVGNMPPPTASGTTPVPAAQQSKPSGPRWKEATHGSRAQCNPSAPVTSG